MPMRVSGVRDGRINVLALEVIFHLKNYCKNDEIKNDSPRLFVVPILKNGQIEIVHNVFDEHIEWADVRQVILFYFNEDGSGCLIRHISDVNRIHKQFIGRNGLRICVNDWIQPMRLCLYHNTSLEEQREVDLNNFSHEFHGIYRDYLDYAKPMKKKQNN